MFYLALPASHSQSIKFLNVKKTSQYMHAALNSAVTGSAGVVLGISTGQKKSKGILTF